jgi:hypothetical protein
MGVLVNSRLWLQHAAAEKEAERPGSARGSGELAINGDEYAAVGHMGGEWLRVWPRDGRGPSTGMTAPTTGPLTENEADSAIT